MSDEQINAKDISRFKDSPSADPRLSRADFLKKVLVAGGILAAPAVLSSFPVQARSMRSNPYIKPGPSGI